MSFGVVMLCHTALDRAAQVARFWAAGGAPVVIHVDARVPAAEFRALGQSLADLAVVSFCRRFRCDWGTWSLVAAAREGAAQLLARHPEARHVYLASGACLPLRPVAELEAYLAERTDTDFIESVTTSEVEWTVGGLDAERFTLYFPFSWKKHRGLFDRSVDFQRRIGFRRHIPGGVTPHLGSQWWCLSRTTLAAILDDPDRAAHDRYFRRVWIPDESYFQSLARRHSTRIESRSLTLSRFDVQGKPHVFYDDHLGLLQASHCFVARKIWPRAERLYDHFLAPRAPESRTEPDPGRIERLFDAAAERRRKGHPGLYMQSRFPRQDQENGKTAAAYSILHGFTNLFEGFEGWLARQVTGRVHGHLYGPGRAAFAGNAQIFAGCLSDSARLRDHNPRAFLTNLIRNGRDERQIFMFGPQDNQAINWFTATDPNAQISVISGAWAVPLFRSGTEIPALRREAARLQRIESQHLSVLRSMFVKARVRIWTLAEFAENPAGPLQEILDEINPRQSRLLTEIPRMADLTGFGLFLQKLRNQGLQPRLMGDFPVGDPVRGQDPSSQTK